MDVEKTESKVRKLEETTNQHGERITALTRRIEESDRKSAEKTEKIFNTLDNIKENQHAQELGNLDLKYTMGNINEFIQKENNMKDESRKDTKQIKYIVMGAGFAFLSSLIIAVIQIIF